MSAREEEKRGKERGEIQSEVGTCSVCDRVALFPISLFFFFPHLMLPSLPPSLLPVYSFLSSLL